MIPTGGHLMLGSSFLRVGDKYLRVGFPAVVFLGETVYDPPVSSDSVVVFSPFSGTVIGVVSWTAVSRDDLDATAVTADDADSVTLYEVVPPLINNPVYYFSFPPEGVAIDFTVGGAFGTNGMQVYCFTTFDGDTPLPDGAIAAAVSDYFDSV